MTAGTNRNDFLLELLALQQDGKSAISAPSNWTTQPPLLEIPTEVDQIVDRLYSSILVSSGRNETASWHFFIGSPGNGKSAAMGKLCRKLLADNSCQIRDEADVSIQDLNPGAIPYSIYVYEGSNKFPSVQIVQDASVVRKPFSSEVDPAKELLGTLREAWEKGISLIVCTNRGVLEKAHRDNHTNHAINSTPWFKVLTSVLSAENSLSGKIDGEREIGSKKSVFKRVRISYSHLDNRSLLLGRDSFDRLWQSATDPVHWGVCDSCKSREMCPFRTNRDWVAEPEPRGRVLLILRRAEVFSGQVIVFREALALVSLVLAGCPRDYDNAHPCDWVHGKVANGDIFALASRRIYMSLFASHCPYGLEASESLRKQQLQSLKALHSATAEEDMETRGALQHVINARAPSTDVGITRLLGKGGVIAEIDPSREGLPGDFYDRWDADFESLRQYEDPAQMSAIEHACAAIWARLERGLELTSGYSSSETHWALRRWSSNYLLHLGALTEGLSAWRTELDDFAGLLSLVARPSAEQTVVEKKKIRALNLELERILDTVAGKAGQGTIPLSDTVTLAGAWVKDELKPKTMAQDASGSVSLAIAFGKTQSERAVLAALMYLWLTRRAAGKLDSRCFPQELLCGATDARIRAAAMGRYALVNNDVELVVDAGREVFRLSRVDGALDVGHE